MTCDRIKRLETLLDSGKPKYFRLYFHYRLESASGRLARRRRGLLFQRRRLFFPLRMLDVELAPCFLLWDLQSLLTQKFIKYFS